MGSQGKGNPLLAALDETSFSLYWREPPICSFIFSRTNLTTRNSIELATQASLLTILRVVCCLRRLILYHRRLLHWKCCMNTITHCTVSKVFLFRCHLSWGKEDTQIDKVKEEKKTPLFKVLSYLDNIAQALLLITPDKCHINLGKKELEHNSSVSSERFSTSLVLTVGRGVTSLPLTETDVLVGDSLDITFSSRYPSSRRARQEKPKAR